MESIVYQDINNNRYILRPNSISYYPIKPEESSSGVYSGGEPTEAYIRKEQFEIASDWVKKIEADKNLHLTQRRMLTSVLSWENGGYKQRLILGKSNLQKGLFDYLKSLF